MRPSVPGTVSMELLIREISAFVQRRALADAEYLRDNDGRYRHQIYTERLFAVILACVFASLTLLHGVPELRQDWGWPVSAAAAHTFLIDSWSGWNASGMGSPVAYPSSYLTAIPLALLLLVCGPKIALFLYIALIGATVTLGCHSLISASKPSTGIAMGLMAFSLFNPWVYTKMVAGHPGMILSYGGIMFLFASVNDGPINWRNAAIALLITFSQLQFFLIGLVSVSLRWRDRGARRACAFGIVIFLPSAFGIIANWDVLHSIPYTLAWQQNQSIAPADVVFLTGYFAGYASPLSIPFHASVALALILAIYGVICRAPNSFARPSNALMIWIGAFAAIVATGTNGVFGGLYSFLVTRFPVTGLYRELYDLLAFVAVAYVGLAAAARAPLASAAAFFCGVTAITAWIVLPIASWTVPRSALPPVKFNAPPNTRYALYPAFQPMTFHGMGSGMDPDLFERGSNVTPLNAYLIQYPESVAMSRYESDGDSGLLSNLSVSTVVIRPWLRTDYRSLKAQLGTAFRSHDLPAGMTITHIPYLPELSVTATPLIGQIANKLGDGNIFFGDAHSLSPDVPQVLSVHAARRSPDPTKDWVDAQFTFLPHTAASQGLGGAATSNNTATLDLPWAHYLLAYVHGVLFDGHTKLASDTHGYRWLHLSGSPRKLSLSCAGYCVVAAEAPALPLVPANPSPRPYRALDFGQPLPWLLIAELAPGDAGGIRYNTDYNRWWIAYVAGHKLRHLRLDQLVNGWILPEIRYPERLIVVNACAAVQTLFEAFGVLISVIVIFLPLRRKLMPA